MCYFLKRGLCFIMKFLAFYSYFLFHVKHCKFVKNATQAYWMQREVYPKAYNLMTVGRGSTAAVQVEWVTSVDGWKVAFPGCKELSKRNDSATEWQISCQEALTGLRLNKAAIDTSQTHWTLFCRTQETVEMLQDRKLMYNTQNI